MDDKQTLIANLQEQIGNYDTQLGKMDGNDPLYAAAYAAIKAERDDAQRKLDALNAEINAGVEAQVQLASQFDSITIGDETVSLRDLIQDETAYQIVSIFFQQKFGDQAQANAALINSYQSQVDKLEEEVSSIDNMRRTIVDLTDKLADMETRRDAAANELEEAQEEAKRLASDNESLRKQLESTAKPSQTNSTTSASAALEAWKASRPAVYDVVEQQSGNKLAKLLETGETVTWEKIYPGKYRIASAEEVERFRASANATESTETKQDSESVALDTPLVTEVPPIQSEVTTTGLDADATVHENDAVSRTEYQALAKRVEQIERTLNISAVA